ncbi:acyl-CoA dehydrogenase [Streptomyces sp. PTM05]|uniref:Acyl-CoA dehydrogenase n=1 Tax=Streptantibioticus parmotrematis TaxID=2873249 RepID=A0ABS7QQV0_9ACTN|nr:acyl-CoA dehydrogenase family protein [Streptantibioticus parmotrematis]MBY8885318.1 acyl-CoA dehydrogenase [Streptantibioticus parmotrematis]
MRDTIARCETTAHAEGLAAGLTQALAAARDGFSPPGRVAALPADRVPPGAAAVRNRLAEREGIGCFVWPGREAERPHHVRPGHETERPHHDGASDDTTTEFAVLLGAVRLGATRRLLEHAVTHLSGRTVGGEPTLRKQLVLGTVADVMTGVEAARHALLTGASVPDAVADTHERLTELDWETTKLLGASGYLADGPARTAHVSRLLADCWVAAPGGTP